MEGMFIFRVLWRGEEFKLENPKEGYISLHEKENTGKAWQKRGTVVRKGCLLRRVSMEGQFY